jgi:hypothetical protein
MAIEVFNRHENKYRLDGDTYAKISARLAEYMEPDGYSRQSGTYAIENIYYDTDDSYLIRTSLAKPAYKEKLRLRAYGSVTPDTKVFLEIKKKYRGVVNKRRSAMFPDEAYRFLATGELPEIKPYMNGQVLKEAQYMLAQRELKPAVYLSYERRAFFGKDDPSLRVSFDTNILTRRGDLKLESGSYGSPLLRDGEWLMEIKAEGALPVWVTKLLAEYGVYPQSFSKYGTEYRQSCETAPRVMPEESEPVMESRPSRGTRIERSLPTRGAASDNVSDSVSAAQGTRFARSLRKLAAGIVAVVRIVN